MHGPNHSYTKIWTVPSALPLRFTPLYSASLRSAPPPQAGEESDFLTKLGRLRFSDRASCIHDIQARQICQLRASSLVVEAHTPTHRRLGHGVPCGSDCRSIRRGAAITDQHRASAIHNGEPDLVSSNDSQRYVFDGFDHDHSVAHHCLVNATHACEARNG